MWSRVSRKAKVRALVPLALLDRWVQDLRRNIRPAECTTQTYVTEGDDANKRIWRAQVWGSMVRE